MIHITKERVWNFLKMYFPAALCGASDWWRVTAIGAVAVSFHDKTALAVFNSSYRILWLSLIFMGSVSKSMSIKLG
jgi:hypothetical protein